MFGRHDRANAIEINRRTTIFAEWFKVKMVVFSYFKIFKSFSEHIRMLRMNMTHDTHKIHRENSWHDVCETFG